MAEPHIRIFVSSVMTQGYLSNERNAACEAIESLKLTVPWDFAREPAQAATPGAAALQELALSDIVVLILGNRHTPPVQEELDEAERLGKPILAFVERVPSSDESSERQGVVAWLRDRVKYQEFLGLEQLKREVVAAVRKELVDGYRSRYRDRLKPDDIRELTHVQSTPGLLVRQAKASDRDAVRETLMELEQWYPDIRQWVEERLESIDEADDIRVAEMDGEIGAVVVVRSKSDDIRKFATLYVRPTARGAAIGPHIVREEVLRAAEEGVRKAYVTCADEIADRLVPILAQSGFTPEGVSRGRYRDGAAEWVLGKNFVYGEVTPSDFLDFVKTRMVTEAGGEIVEDQGNVFSARLPRLGLAGSARPELIWYVVSSGDRPEEDYVAYKGRFEQQSWTFVSLGGRPADVSHELHEAEAWMDAADLSSQFYPVELASHGQRSLIVTIRPEFAQELIPSSRAPSMLPPTRLQVRPDNVYYRAPDRYQELRRGSRLFFYVSDPEQRIRGSAGITDVFVGNPEDCFARYGTRGLYDYQRLEDIAQNHDGKVLAIAFDWYREFTAGVNLPRLRSIIPNYNPQSAYLASAEYASAILREGFRHAE
ncbi:MAG: DUF4062 domain-containing protein [Chloroflexi bacterium]|nr:DUF4062 domain-containing protein [Chloroflexota bacterium]